MTDREKLIELLKAGGKLAVEENHKYIREFVKNHGRYTSKTDNNVSFDEIVADYLLENGVCVPLVNENDTVYIILLNKVIPFNIIYVNLYQKQFFFKGQHGLNLSYTFKTDDIGKTVFLTREEAEKVLKEREQCSTKD